MAQKQPLSERLNPLSILITVAGFLWLAVQYVADTLGTMWYPTAVNFTRIGLFLTVLFVTRRVRNWTHNPQSEMKIGSVLVAIWLTVGVPWLAVIFPNAYLHLPLKNDNDLISTIKREPESRGKSSDEIASTHTRTCEIHLVSRPGKHDNIGDWRGLPEIAAYYDQPCVRQNEFDNIVLERSLRESQDGQQVVVIAYDEARAHKGIGENLKQVWCDVFSWSPRPTGGWKRMAYNVWLLHRDLATNRVHIQGIWGGLTPEGAETQHTRLCAQMNKSSAIGFETSETVASVR